MVDPKAGAKGGSARLVALNSTALPRSTLGRNCRWGWGAAGSARPWMAWSSPSMLSSCPEPCEAWIRAGHGLGDRCCVMWLEYFLVVLIDASLSGQGPAALHLEFKT